MDIEDLADVIEYDKPDVSEDDLEMSIRDYMIKSRVELNKENAFFGHLTNRLNLVETEQIDTMAVDFRGNLYYNPNFVIKLLVGSEDDLSVKNPSDPKVDNALLKAVLVHETLHLALKGDSRKGDRDHHTFNIAQDIIINDIIVNEEDRPLPKNNELVPNSRRAVELTHFEDDGSKSTKEIDELAEESFESIYEKIEDLDLPTNPMDGMIYSGDGDGESPGGGGGIPDDVDPEDVARVDMDPEEAEEKWDMEVDKAASKSRGLGGGSLSERVKRSRVNPIDYKEYIKRTLSGIDPVDYTYVQPSKKSQSVGEVLPGTKKEDKARAIIAIDTSGSMSTEDLRNAAGEIGNIIDSFSEIDITLIQHDAEIQEVKAYPDARTNDFRNLEAKGRGGTDHEPVFEEVEDLADRRSAVICITDGFTNVPDKCPVPEQQLLWIVNNHRVDKSDLKHGVVLRRFTDD